MQAIDGSVSHDLDIQVFLQGKVLWTLIAHFICSYTVFSIFSFWQPLYDTSEKVLQLTQGMVEKLRYFNLLELCLCVLFKQSVLTVVLKTSCTEQRDLTLSTQNRHLLSHGSIENARFSKEAASDNGILVTNKCK